MSNRRKVLAIVGVVVGVLALWSGFCLWQASRAGNRVRSALVAAENSLQAHDVAATRKHLADASSALDAMDSNLSRLGPIRTVGKVTPIVRVQLRGVEAFVGAGRELTSSASRLTDALDGLLHPSVPDASLETTLEPMRNLDKTLADGLVSLDKATDKMNTLRGYRLLGPLDGARRDLDRRLAEGHQKAIDAKNGVDALLDFVGGNGPRRYLVLAQNPDELRPTGGFIGSYGVLTADGAKVHMERFDGIEDWYHAHPGVFVPTDQAATPFRLSDTSPNQNLSNVNASVDWPTDAKLAQDLWARGGEAPVNGVLLITPDMLARVLKVLGPVQVPDYNETVTSSNLLERLDFHTHVEGYIYGAQPGGRKEFLSALAEPVMKAVLHAGSEKWVDLGQEFAASGDAREWMAWSELGNVQSVIEHQGWDGGLPLVRGDFFYNGEFEYSAKNGRGLQRTFDHVVQVNPDGSGTVATTMTLKNPLPSNLTGGANPEANMYTVMYGPVGAELDSSADEPDIDRDDPVSNHPGVGYSVDAQPLGSATVKVVWRVPDLLTRGPDGKWRFELHWLHVPTNRADALHLQVKLPDGWKWATDAPPSEVRLDRDFNGEWSLHDNS